MLAYWLEPTKSFRSKVKQTEPSQMTANKLMTNIRLKVSWRSVVVDLNKLSHYKAAAIRCGAGKL